MKTSLFCIDNNFIASYCFFSSIPQKTLAYGLAEVTVAMIHSAGLWTLRKSRLESLLWVWFKTEKQNMCSV